MLFDRLNHFFFLDCLLPLLWRDLCELFSTRPLPQQNILTKQDALWVELASEAIGLICFLLPFPRDGDSFGLIKASL